MLLWCFQSFYNTFSFVFPHPPDMHDVINVGTEISGDSRVSLKKLPSVKYFVVYSEPDDSYSCAWNNTDFFSYLSVTGFLVRGGNAWGLPKPSSIIFGKGCMLLECSSTVNWTSLCLCLYRMQYMNSSHQELSSCLSSSSSLLVQALIKPHRVSQPLYKCMAAVCTMWLKSLNARRAAGCPPA